MVLAFLLAALLYSSVGHGGASGYLMVMALAGLAPAVMRPTALTLNLLVSVLGTLVFVRSGHFQGRLFWPLVITSVPMAWWGGRTDLPDGVFKVVLGLVLALAAVRLVLPQPEEAAWRPPSLGLMALAGAVIGGVSGLVGVGGGIFLTPLLLFCRWCAARTAAAVSAPFIAVNSLAALVGQPGSLAQLPGWWPVAAVVVVLGGWCGARWGSQVARVAGLRAALALVLGVASVKMLLP